MISARAPLFVRAHFDGRNLSVTRNNSFRKQKARDKVKIVAWSTQRQAKWLTVHADFQRLFGGKIIVNTTCGAILPFGYLRHENRGLYWGHFYCTAFACPARNYTPDGAMPFTRKPLSKIQRSLY